MLRKRLWTNFLKLDVFLDKHALALALALLVLIIRLPSVAEPYWYGDEAIYLTLGNSLSAGERLYVDIIDHKTPLIYYIAQAAGSQFGFRMLGTGATIVSTLAFYYLLRDFFSRPAQRCIALFVFILYTNLPRYEGNIPNGETFVMMFVFLALLAFRRTRIYQTFLTPSSKVPTREYIVKSTNNTLWLLLSGALMGLATLTKVPAVFDLALLFVVGWFVYSEAIFRAIDQQSTFTKAVLSTRSILSSITVQLGVVFVGWISMILLSIIYYFFRGSLEQYIDYGLLYNFRYAGSWNPQFPSAIVAFFFTLKGKLLLLVIWLATLTVLRRYLSKALIFSGAWLSLSLFAATLSNRPYPHYFLQVMPALAMLVSVAFGVVLYTIKRCRHDKKTGDLLCDTDATRPLFDAAACFIIISALTTTLNFLHVEPYPTVRYYTLFYKLATKQITWEEYRDQFNSVLRDNYQVAKVLRRSPDQEIFIWGNNPLLYALSGKNPVGRFTVAFHIDDFNAYGETIDAIEAKKPTFVVVMKEQTPLPGLREYLNAEYIPNSDYPTMTVWRRSTR